MTAFHLKRNFIEIDDALRLIAPNQNSVESVA